MKITAMLGVALPLAAVVLVGPTQSQQLQTGVAYSPGKNFDQLSWSAFVAAVKPAVKSAPAGATTFETWATDADTFETTPPRCPEPNAPAVAAARPNNNRFQTSFLARAHQPTGLREGPAAAQVGGVPTACGKPNNPAAGNFPTPVVKSPPGNCVAEEVRRNYAACKFIKDNKLYTQADLAKAFTGKAISFPKDAVELKMDWMPVDTVVVWLNNNGEKINGADITADYVRKNYFLTKQPDGTEYAMVSMHVSTKDRPNWLWATFEHQNNPGRCDTTGCYDDYGVTPPLAAIPPQQAANTQYPACAKSPELASQFTKAGLSAVWSNYCLKGTQIDYVSTQAATKGQPLLDGDSVIERITADVPINQSSCITCHAYATFGKDGCVFFASNPGLGSPGPIGNPTPQTGQKSYDFVWGLIAANYAQACTKE